MKKTNRTLRTALVATLLLGFVFVTNAIFTVPTATFNMADLTKTDIPCDSSDVVITTNVEEQIVYGENEAEALENYEKDLVDIAKTTHKCEGCQVSYKKCKMVFNGWTVDSHQPELTMLSDTSWEVASTSRDYKVFCTKCLPPRLYNAILIKYPEIIGDHFPSELPMIAPDENSNVIENTRVFPSPASDEVFVDIDLSIGLPELSLTVTDINGYLIHTETILDYAAGANRMALDVNQLPAGIYILVLHDKNQRYETTRFVVAR